MQRAGMHASRKGAWVVLTVIPLVLIGLISWNFNRPPFDLTRLQALSAGMGQEDVRKVLGHPTTVSNLSWSYSRFLAWPIVKVRFDEFGKLKDWEYDY